jgi:hypothetical protein
LDDGLVRAAGHEEREGEYEDERVAEGPEVDLRLKGKELIKAGVKGFRY